MKDFFISYNKHDKQWAEWIAWTLEEADYTVVIQAWDFRPGGNFALDMNKAVAETQTTIAVLSETFLQSDYTAPEWAAAFARDPRSTARKLIPVRVGECQPEGLLAQIVYVDLVGVTEVAAKELVLGALKERAKPAQKPGFPGATPPLEERVEPLPVAFPEPSAPAPSTPTIPTFTFDVVTVNAQGQENNRLRGQAQYSTQDWVDGLVLFGNGMVLEQVSIPGGTFQMGALDSEGTEKERPQHTVTVKPFLMGKYPVTQAQWQAVAALPKVKHDLKADPSTFKGSNRPVEGVSWHEAVEFCARLATQTQRDYRLPSEAEWEYACRAGTTTPFHFGETITTDLANYDGNYTYASSPKGEDRQQTTEVGTFPPNAFGLYDMHGNVWEWCLDHWHDNYQGAPIDGSAWNTGGNDKYRLLRGGSWTNYPSYCRSAYRNRFKMGSRSHSLGFRVVCASE